MVCWGYSAATPNRATIQCSNCSVHSEYPYSYTPTCSTHSSTLLWDLRKPVRKQESIISFCLTVFQNQYFRLPTDHIPYSQNQQMRRKNHVTSIITPHTICLKIFRTSLKTDRLMLFSRSHGLSWRGLIYISCQDKLIMEIGHRIQV